MELKMKNRIIKLIIGQINPVVGDIDYNRNKIVHIIGVGGIKWVKYGLREKFHRKVTSYHVKLLLKPGVVTQFYQKREY